MKAIILCGGYGTRLGELGEKCPKALLEIAKKPLIEYIIDKIDKIKEFNETIIVSNHKFINDFVLWKEKYGNSKVRILDDGSTNNENRLGGLKDLEFVLDSCDVKEDFLVIAGDNLIEFNLSDFYGKFKESGENTIVVYDIRDIEKVRNRHGVVVLDENKRVVEFQEKPEKPKSTIKSICCYFFKPEVQKKLKEYLEKGRNPDASGFFIEWLCKRKKIYAYDIGKNKVFDIGNLESLKEVRRAFAP